MVRTYQPKLEMCKTTQHCGFWRVCGVQNRQIKTEIVQSRAYLSREPLYIRALAPEGRFCRGWLSISLQQRFAGKKKSNLNLR